ncbi:hypothetical protein [Streptomyces sp. NPDC048650]|uniref:hypothetical protein n=1 Tax=unclassified Streptomyces TaxID=2593676 RepID=UPI003713E54D
MDVSLPSVGVMMRIRRAGVMVASSIAVVALGASAAQACPAHEGSKSKPGKHQEALQPPNAFAQAQAALQDVATEVLGDRK